jgi:hypothetical protein
MLVEFKMYEHIHAEGAPQLIKYMIPEGEVDWENRMLGSMQNQRTADAIY